MKILHVTYTDSSGGAAIATRRLVEALNSNGVKADILVRVKKTDNYNVIGPKNVFFFLYNRFRYSLGQLFYRLKKEPDPCLHSLNIIPSRWHLYINSSDYDIVHLHWIGGETINIKDIGKIRKPIVWTFHDMWPFCGAEHLSKVSDNAPWINGYKIANWNKVTWLRKKKYFKNKNINIIAPSKWMEKCARSSYLFCNSKIKMVPNYLDTRIYKPVDKRICRKLLNIESDKFVILFGAVGGIVDENKGFNFLIQALNQLKLDKSRVLCMVFGQSKPQSELPIPFEVKWLGKLNDDVTLTVVYNSASVLVVPSKIDTFPQTATEAQSCGCPVVAFDTTGLSYLVEHKYSGYLAEPFDSNDLANGIEWVYTKQDELEKNCTDNANRKWNPENVIESHLKYYNEV
ncbi:TPA: glycosyltransferase, partial [Escherichia coli]|nr:glycosyltransferase [Escherichia coli]